MADYTPIPDTALDPDAPLTSELAYAWRDNPIAIAEGAVDAPRIVSGALATMTGSLSGSVGSETLIRVSLPVYCFFPDIRRGPGTARLSVDASTGSSSPGTPGFSLYNSSGTSAQTYAVDYRYITA